MKRTVDPALDALREQALRMGSLAEAILDKAMRAIRERNADLCTEVQHDDLEIDRLDVSIDEAVVRVLATQGPVANDLRRILAVKTMATDLERIGDLARNIAKSGARLAESTPVPLPDRLEEMADSTRRLLRRALDAFAGNDPDAARAVLEADDEIDEAEDRLVQEEIEAIGARPEFAAQGVDLILIAKHLERAADHATNIAEDVIFLAEARNVKHAAKLGRN